MIRKSAFGIGLFVLSLPLLAAEALPVDVETFVATRESCDHFRGEIPGPSEKRRMRAVNREIRKWCKGTDTKLAKLKKKYATNSAVTHRLEEFEPDIEPK